MAQHHPDTSVTLLGIDDDFVTHGTVAQLKHLCGIDDVGIASAIRNVLNNHNNKQHNFDIK